jgi:DNA modification methylase
MDKNTKKIIKSIGKKEWTNPPYSVQSWGNWIHRISPYVGRIKPSFAYFLIKHVSKEGDIILDPFCGIGTIPTEASLMKRKSIGIDLNPYGYAIARGKSDNKRKLDELIKYLENIKVDIRNTSIKNIPNWVKEYYNQKTLKEIQYLLKKLKRDKQYLLLACLIGISQGHRPGHLSKPCAWTLPYKPKPDDKGEYREVIPRLIEKIKRTFINGFQDISKMDILLADARKMPLKDNSVDHIISSPPYYDTLDYVNSHRLRLAVMGYYEKEKNKKLKSKLIQKFDTYIIEMEKTIKEMSRVLKNNGYCILIVGDCFRRNETINTAEEIKPILEKYYFECHAIIEDFIPINKSVQKRTKNRKSERIMILTKK